MTEIWATCLVVAVLSIALYIMKERKENADKRFDILMQLIKEHETKEDKRTLQNADALRDINQTVIQILQSLSGYVQKNECTSDMGKHCELINTLQADITNNTQRIATLETYVNVYHKKQNKI